MAQPPTKITATEFAAMDLAGRRFRSREGQSQFRGVVLGAVAQNARVVVSVASTEKQQGSVWEAVPDFEYAGNEAITTIWRDASGRISIDIMHVGSIVIFPADA